MRTFTPFIFLPQPVILKETFTTFILPTKVNFNPYFLTRGRFTYLLRLKVPTNMQNYIMTHTFFFNELYAIMGWTYNWLNLTDEAGFINVSTNILI